MALTMLLGILILKNALNFWIGEMSSIPSFAHGYTCPWGNIHKLSNQHNKWTLLIVSLWNYAMKTQYFGKLILFWMPFNYLQNFNYQKIDANWWNCKSLFVCLKQGGHYFLSVLSHVLLNLKIWTCVLLFKPPPNVLKFIVGFNIFNKKSNICWSF